MRKTTPWNDQVLGTLENVNDCVLLFVFSFGIDRGIDQSRYIKIQPKTIDLSTRLWGITRVCVVYSPEPRAEVYRLRLNFNISKLVYLALALHIKSGRRLEYFRWLTTILRDSVARYDCLQDVNHVARAKITQVALRNQNHFHLKGANFGIRSDSFKLRSNVCLIKPRANKITRKVKQLLKS